LVFIKLLQPLILPVLSQPFILTSFTFSLVGKNCNVVPIQKPHSPMDESDYRPIFILPVLRKAFENVMFELMSDYVVRNNLISPFQSGFRSGHRTMTALVRVSEFGVEPANDSCSGRFL
jgi:hypothetical protein